MSMSFHSRRLFLNMAAAITGAALLAACGSSSGTSDDTIVIGGHNAITGPSAISGTTFDGVKARVKVLNDAGGINGMKIKLKIADDKLDPAAAPGAVRSLTNDKDVKIICCGGSATSAAVLPFLKQQKILSIAASGSDSLIADADSPYRLVVPDYSRLTAQVVKYAVEELGATKVAIAYTPDAVGEPTLKGAKDELKRLGMKPVAEVSYSPTATSLAAQAAELKASGADFVVVNHVASVASVLIKANERLGFKPNYGATWAMGTPALADILGTELDGRIYFSTPFLLPDSDEAAEYRDAVAQIKGADYKNTNVMLGWTLADGMVALLEKAVEDNGGKAPTREQVLEAANGLTVETAFIKQLSWSAKDFSGSEQAQITKMSGGEFVGVGDFEALPEG